MKASVRGLFDLKRAGDYRAAHAPPMVLVNGLAEQSESWFANVGYWSRFFDVKVPEILVYDGDALHRQIDAGGDVSVDFLSERLGLFLDEFVQRPPYDLVGSSLGGQVVLHYAARHPERVNRIVLVCPSGLWGDENLPMMDGVKRSNYESLVRSVFHRTSYARPELVKAIERKFQSRKWKKGVLRTLRGTVGHSVTPLLEQVPHPTLAIWGEDDRVLSDLAGSVRAAGRMTDVRQVVIPKCGHAPQIERSRLVNALVMRFLRDRWRPVPPAFDAARFLERQEKGRGTSLSLAQA